MAVEYVDTLSMNWIVQLKKAMVAETFSDFKSCKVIYLFHKPYKHILSWQMLQNSDSS